MRSFEETQKHYDEILKIIEQKKSELKSLENEKYRISNMLWESRFSKNVLTRDDFYEIFKRNAGIVWSNPYYNECKKEYNSIQVSIGTEFKYFYLDNDNKIIGTYNADDHISKSLIGKFVDLNSYEGEGIRGNHQYHIGIIKDGKFQIEL